MKEKKLQFVGIISIVAIGLIGLVLMLLLSPDFKNDDKQAETTPQTIVLEIQNISMEIPDYWTEEDSTTGRLRYYAEKSDSMLDCYTVSLTVEFAEDDDPNYDVSFAGLEADNENMIKALEEKYTDANMLSHEVFESNHGVKGMLYKFSLNQSTGLFSEEPAKGYCFCFASEADRRWYYVTMIKINSAEGKTYEDDYMKIISSIVCDNTGATKPTQESTTPTIETKPQPTTPQVTTPPETEPQVTEPQQTTPVKPTSEYEKAFVRAMSNYSLYYMFDTDTNAVVYFSSHDTFVDNGTYSGEFSSGVTITWDHGEWTETFTNKSGSNDATMIDGNGFDWEYKVCSVEDAQKILDGIE